LLVSFSEQLSAFHIGDVVKANFEKFLGFFQALCDLHVIDVAGEVDKLSVQLRGF
jgi:hypothetical protein